MERQREKEREAEREKERERKKRGLPAIKMDHVGGKAKDVKRYIFSVNTRVWLKYFVLPLCSFTQNGRQ